jgi:hypothetical protein
MCILFTFSPGGPTFPGIPCGPEIYMYVLCANYKCYSTWKRAASWRPRLSVGPFWTNWTFRACFTRRTRVHLQRVKLELTSHCHYRLPFVIIPWWTSFAIFTIHSIITWCACNSELCINEYKVNPFDSLIYLVDLAVLQGIDSSRLQVNT